ncbi:serine carboxypeptidase-like 11 [Salvia hispanica]|uniref:serine carboxypeptidase-like 11 n=1 Tax=Salvia hispanica TaxID=49212 RepID=UPI002009AF3B|nr:serine carboxypeptidase-like 11 [Salvia hispanica]
MWLMKPFLHFLVLLFVRFKSAASQSIVETLPGYDGALPFKLETGYIGVGENDEVQLFYYFVESENHPARDPLLLWLIGGPGCAALSGFFYEIGPLAFDFENFDGSLPSLVLNPYSWTKVANIIFLDYPVGAGFSYSNTTRGYSSSDTNSTQHNYTFLRKWLLAHPEFIKNRFYVTGDSYGGKIVPMLALQIAKGNEAGLEPIMSLKGYIVGNPVTYEAQDTNEQIPYAHRMALISDKQFEQARISCNGEYVNPDPNNVECLFALYIINQCTKFVNHDQILNLICKEIPTLPEGGFRRFLPSLVDDPIGFLSLSSQNEPPCHSHYVTSYVWANDETVREALHIREGMVPYWTRCNVSVTYEKDIESVVEYHQNLSDRGFQALVYSGDHDMSIPYIATLKWIRKLNVSMYDEWRAWTVDGQVAGYTELYKSKIKEAYLMFATIKGAGHTAPEYKPRECLEMLRRWLSLFQL